MNIKYTLLLSLSFCFFAAMSSSQNKLFLGLKGGLSIPSLQAGESENVWNKNYQSRVGPYYGLVAEIPLSKYFSLQPEIMFAAQGGKRKGIQPMTIPEDYVDVFQQVFNTDKDYLFANLNTTSKINYLQIPIQLKFAYPIAFDGKLNFIAQFGPYVGYMLQAKQIVESKNLHVYFDEEGKEEIPQVLVKEFFGASIDTTINSYPELHHFNFGIQGGVGFAYFFKNSQVFIEGGGNYGFLYLQKDDSHGKNNIGAGTINIGYLINVRKK